MSSTGTQTNSIGLALKSEATNPYSVNSATTISGYANSPFKKQADKLNSLINKFKTNWDLIKALIVKFPEQLGEISFIPNNDGIVCCRLPNTLSAYKNTVTDLQKLTNSPEFNRSMFLNLPKSYDQLVAIFKKIRHEATKIVALRDTTQNITNTLATIDEIHNLIPSGLFPILDLNQQTLKLLGLNTTNDAITDFNMFITSDFELRVSKSTRDKRPNFNQFLAVLLEYRRNISEQIRQLRTSSITVGVRLDEGEHAILHLAGATQKNLDPLIGLEALVLQCATTRVCGLAQLLINQQTNFDALSNDAEKIDTYFRALYENSRQQALQIRAKQNVDNLISTVAQSLVPKHDLSEAQQSLLKLVHNLCVVPNQDNTPALADLNGEKLIQQAIDTLINEIVNLDLSNEDLEDLCNTFQSTDKSSQLRFLVDLYKQEMAIIQELEDDDKKRVQEASQTSLVICGIDSETAEEISLRLGHQEVDRRIQRLAKHIIDLQLLCNPDHLISDTSYFNLSNTDFDKHLEDVARFIRYIRHQLGSQEPRHALFPDPRDLAPDTFSENKPRLERQHLSTKLDA